MTDVSTSAKSSTKPWTSFQVRKRDTEVKRDAVLLTAAHLFLEQGYRRTAMSQLADRLKITKPALYHYFHNKEEIVIECYRRGIALIESSLQTADAGQTCGLDKLRVYVEAYATAIVRYEFGRCVAWLDDGELSPAAQREVRSLKRRIDATLRGFITEGQRDGSVGACDSKLAAFAIAGAVNWIGVWYQPGGPLTPEAIGAQYAALLTNGLRRRAESP
jgi:AcrR family transcriptional regulator